VSNSTTTLLPMPSDSVRFQNKFIPGSIEIESANVVPNSTSKSTAKILVAEDADDLRNAIVLVLLEKG